LKQAAEILNLLPRVQTRRDFLRGAGAFALSAALPLDRTEPDLILYNANIITIDDALPRAKPSLFLVAVFSPSA
jgi:hypothetical protein